MKRMQWMITAVIFLAAQLVSAATAPVSMLESASTQIIDSLKENKSQLKSNHKIIYQAVEHYLLPHVDVQGMSRSVLGRASWAAASAAEKQEFMQVFTQLVIRTYATPLAEYTNETIKYLPIRGAATGQFVRVNSVIMRSSGQNISLTYSLVSKNDQWKIYDLSVEGVSLLQSFHSQFGQILQNSTMKDLIAQMRKNSMKVA